jgi:hypothetical protein
MPKPVRGDLFAMFPDLPRMRHRTPEEQIRRVHQQVQAVRDRARLNIGRQKKNAARVQTQLAALPARRKRRGR